jgi:hypothetical protein
LNFGSRRFLDHDRFFFDRRRWWRWRRRWRRRCDGDRRFFDDFRHNSDRLNGFGFGWRGSDDRSGGRRFDDDLRLGSRRRRRWFECRGCRRRSGFGERRRGRRLDGFDEARRTEYGRSWLGRLWLLGCRGLLRAALGGHWMLGEHVAAGKGDAALTRHPLDERACNDFLDGARCALQLDAVVALEQCEHFLARRVEQLRDFVNPNR